MRCNSYLYSCRDIEFLDSQHKRTVALLQDICHAQMLRGQRWFQIFLLRPMSMSPASARTASMLRNYICMQWTEYAWLLVADDLWDLC